ncbi:MAG: protein translocase subunit SecF [Euryarchaeota archaeon]
MKAIDAYVRNLDRLMLVTLAFTAACTGALVTVGIKLGVDLKGGTMLVLKSNQDPDTLARQASRVLGVPDVQAVRSSQGTILLQVPKYLSAGDASRLERALHVKIESMQTVGPALGRAFWRSVRIAVPLAIVAVAAIVFAIFRRPLLSATVLAALALDLVDALGLMSLTGIPLTLASFAGLLMIIGYAVDSNILLSMYTVKRRRARTVEASIRESFKTGMTMTLTTSAAAGALFLLSASEAIFEIAAVVVFGLLADVLNTWVFNAWVIKEKIAGR